MDPVENPLVRARVGRIRIDFRRLDKLETCCERGAVLRLTQRHVWVVEPPQAPGGGGKTA